MVRRPNIWKNLTNIYRKLPETGANVLYAMAMIHRGHRDFHRLFRFSIIPGKPACRAIIPTIRCFHMHLKPATPVIERSPIKKWSHIMPLWLVPDAMMFQMTI
jgi:hypothetical protein